MVCAKKVTENLRSTYMYYGNHPPEQSTVYRSSLVWPARPLSLLQIITLSFIVEGKGLATLPCAAQNHPHTRYISDVTMSQIHAMIYFSIALITLLHQHAGSPDSEYILIIIIL